MNKTEVRNRRLQPAGFSPPAGEDVDTDLPSKLAKPNKLILQHYQGNTREAFSKGFTMRTGYECLGPEVYEVHRYYLPCQVAKKFRFLRSYFQFLDEPTIPIVHRRRRHPCEFAETVTLMLSRMEHALRTGRSFIIGSQHVSALPWATVGPEHKARLTNNFSVPGDLLDRYKNYLHGKCFPVELHFRTCSGLMQRLATRLSDKVIWRKNLSASANFWFTIAIALTWDLVRHSGPDCPETLELFTNDRRVGSDNFDLGQWLSRRALVFCKTPLPVAPPEPKSRNYDRPPLKFAYKTVVEELSCGELEAGERCKPTFLPARPKPVISYPNTAATAVSYSRATNSSTVVEDAIGFENMAAIPWSGGTGLGISGRRYKYHFGGMIPDMV